MVVDDDAAICRQMASGFATAGYIVVNLVVDLLYGLLDPRIRRGRI